MMKTKPVGEPAFAQVAGGRAEDWPLTCICNLCQCGNHRCSNFSWDEERASRLARSLDQRELDQQSASSGDMDAGSTCRAHHTCEYYQLNERYLTRDANTNGNGEANRKSRPNEAQKAVGDAAKRSREAATATLGKPKHSCNDEMLHVLVTRPEIAGRPRDNIVFEGDMDLKSTFETSYNALARMRLEHWKRHQEARNAQSGPPEDEQQEVSFERGERHSNNRKHTEWATPNQTEGASERAARRPGHKHQQRHQRSRAMDDHVRQRRQISGQRRSEENKLERDHELFREQQEQRESDRSLVDGENYLQDTPKQHRIKQMRLDNNDSMPLEQFDQQATRTDGSRRLVHSPPPSPAKQLVMASPISRVRTPSPIDINGHSDGPEGREAAGQTQIEQSRSIMDQQQQQAHAPDSQRAATGVPSKYSIRQQEESSKINDTNALIDPDLAPIICYDPNMNRLERVGLRKRSKYRPSTSLRPGGRGFFGGEASESDSRIDGQYQESASTQTIGHRSEQVQADATRATSTSPSGAAGATTKELDRGNDNKLSGRRHLLDHMGRVDHIKEGEVEDEKQRRFEDKSTLTEALAREELDKQLAEKAEALSLAAANQQVDLDRRLAEEEESAAVAEIERCTREPLESQRQQYTPEPQAGALSNLANQVTNERSRASSRQSRQQRMCQDQSFSICENEYPDARGAFDDDYCIKIGGRTSSSSRASQREQHSGSPFNLATARAGRAKNLFRESPDFVLTTGNLRQQEASARPNNGPLKTPENGPEQLMVEGRFSQMSAISENDGEIAKASGREVTTPAVASRAARLPCSPSCRVLNLDSQYEYVGSRSGHKYFLERDLSSREPMLISENA